MSPAALHIFAFLLMQLPWLVEAAFDAFMWKKFPWDGSDKPWSTWIVRPLVVAGSTWAASAVGGVEWYYVLPLIIVIYGLIFPFVINWVLGRSWRYESKTDNKWTFDYWIGKMNDWVYLGIRVGLVGVFVTLYFW